MPIVNKATLRDRVFPKAPAPSKRVKPIKRKKTMYA